MTAGHNALRGTGPGQSPHSMMQWHKWVVLIAGSTALHYVLFALPTFTSRRMSCLRRKRDGFSVALASGHHRPGHPGDLVGECEGRNLGRSPYQ